MGAQESFETLEKKEDFISGSGGFADRGTTSNRIGLLHELADKREIKYPVEMPVKVIVGN